MPKPKENPWLGIMCDLGDGYYVVADSREHAERALLAAWRKHDRLYGTPYSDKVGRFEDLAEIYGAFVQCVPWNETYRYGS